MLPLVIRTATAFCEKFEFRPSDNQRREIQRNDVGPRIEALNQQYATKSFVSPVYDTMNL